MNTLLRFFSMPLLCAMVLVCGSCSKDDEKEGASGGNGTSGGHAYVDLGLPSGTLWATCNVGASSAEGYGSYFAWGETKTKSSYTDDNYVFQSESAVLAAIDNVKSKKPIDGDYGMGNLLAKYDAATANWGSDWRLPTGEEVDELCKSSTKKWTTQGGVSGMLFTGKNGNTIFFPAAGEFENKAYGVGDMGAYLSSTCLQGGGISYLFFNSDGEAFADDEDGEAGFSVRPVRKK